MEELKTLLIVLAVFLVAYFAPVGDPRVQSAVLESLYMVQEYARQHVLFCLAPVFFIAGAMQNFVSNKSVMRYLGQGAKQWLAYAPRQCRARYWLCVRARSCRCSWASTRKAQVWALRRRLCTRVRP